MACPLHKQVPAGTGFYCRPGHPCSARGLQRGRNVSVTYVYGSSSNSTITSRSPSEPSSVKDGTITVKVTPPREVSQPPSPPSLIHSPVYVQKALIKPSTDSTPTPPATTMAARTVEKDEEMDAGSANSLLWALKQVDRSLDELEQNPLPLQKEIYELSRSPVGTATSSAITTAARVTVAATKEAVKAAVPVGQWMVKEGTKAALSLVSRAMAESAKQQQQKQVKGPASDTGAQGKQAGKDGDSKRK